MKFEQNFFDTKNISSSTVENGAEHKKDVKLLKTCQHNQGAKF